MFAHPNVSSFNIEDSESEYEYDSEYGSDGERIIVSDADIENIVKEKLKCIEKREIDPDYPSILVDNFTCSICMGVYERPITLLCQHTFCFDCVHKYENQNEKKITIIFNSNYIYLSLWSRSYFQ
jgi:hypothetical protein